MTQLTHSDMGTDSQCNEGTSLLITCITPHPSPYHSHTQPAKKVVPVNQLKEKDMKHLELLQMLVNMLVTSLGEKEKRREVSLVDESLHYRVNMM